MIDERPDWQTYFLGIAEAVSRRATCPRASVGAVIVANGRILASGYNGAPSGKPHCDLYTGCRLVDGHCQTAVHAEVNAIASAARFGIAIEGAQIYVWGKEVCPNCRKLIAACGMIIAGWHEVVRV